MNNGNGRKTPQLAAIIVVVAVIAYGLGLGTTYVAGRLKPHCGGHRLNRRACRPVW